MGQQGFQQFLAQQAQNMFSPEALGMVEQRAGMAGQLTPEEERLINESLSLGLASGESDIRRFGEESLGFLRQELAPSRGLRPSDTPIVDRGQQVVEEMLRQQGQLRLGLGQQAAQARLQYPLQRQTFQEQLRQQAFANRLAMTGQAGQHGLGMAGLTDPTRLQTLLLQERLAQPTVETSGHATGTSRGSKWGIGAGLEKPIGGIIGLR